MFTRKDLTKLLAPLIVEQILAVLVGMVDVMMVAAVGEAAVSGVSLVDSISVLIIQILAALATGGAVVSAQYLGKKQSENACRAAGQLVGVTTVLSLVVTTAALIGNRHLLGAVFGKVETAVMNDAVIYFGITALSYPFIAVYNSCAALFRSMGNSRISMVISIVMNNIIRINRLSELRPNLHMIRNILSIGIPNGLESGMFQFGKIALQSLVSSLGTAAIASYAVASNLVTLLYLPGNSNGLGLITIVGQCIGAGEKGQAKQYTRQLTGINYAILLVLCTVMIVFGGQLVGIYQLSPEASAISKQMITAHSIAMVVWPLAFTIPYTLRASLDAKFTMAVSVFSMWVFRIAFAYLFVRVFQLGVMGVWYGMFIDWIFRAAVFSLRFHGLERRAVSVS